MSVILSLIRNFGMIIKYGWPFLILIWMFIARSMMKKFPIDAVIFEKRGENLVKTNDSFIKIVEWEYNGNIKIGDRLK